MTTPTDARPAPLPPPPLTTPITPQSWRLHAISSTDERFAVVGWTAARPVMVPLDGPTDRVVVPDPEGVVFLRFVDPLDGRELARVVRETCDAVLTGGDPLNGWGKIDAALRALRDLAGQV